MTPLRTTARATGAAMCAALLAAVGLGGPAATATARVGLATPACAPSAAPATAPAGHGLAADADTVFLVESDLAAGRLVDRTGRTAPAVKGWTVVADERFGACLKVGDDAAAGVTIPDGGAFSLAGGMTLDAWVFLEQPPPARVATLAVKAGSFAWDLGNGKLNTTWLTFPTEPVATTAPAQFAYYPVGGETINGLMNVPVGRWVRLTAAYDEAAGAVINLVDGVVDRHRYRGAEPMRCDPARPLTILQGVPGARLGPVRLRHGRPRLVPPSLEAYANALPYEGKVLLTLDHVDPDLPLPVDVTVVWEKPNGPAATARTLALDRHARVDVELDLPTWRNVTHTLMVRAAAGGRQVLARDLRVSAAKPAGNVTIAPDRSLVRDGKPLFPLVVYHVPPDDMPAAAGVGFNVVINDFLLNRAAPGDPAKYEALLAESLDAAAKNGLLLLPAAGAMYNKLRPVALARGHAATLGWYGADEPWGDLGRLVESYNTLKLLDPDLPVVVVQNNYSRLQDTAMGADVLGVDPYPVPNVSLRAVPDATKAAARAAAGRKPVWTVIPQYGPKVPTRDELRCMAWLAVAAGADGVGFFCWDERVRDPDTGALTGWYTKEHPDQIEDLRAVVGEMRQLDRVLLARPAAAPAQDPANPAVHASARAGDGKRYLVVANDSRRAEETTLALAGVGDVDAPCLSAADAPPLPVRGGVAKVALPPLGVGVYDVTGARQ